MKVHISYHFLDHANFENVINTYSSCYHQTKSIYLKNSKFTIEYGHYNDNHSTKFVKQFNNQSMHSYMHHFAIIIIPCGILKFYDMCNTMWLSNLESKKKLASLETRSGTKRIRSLIDK